LHGDLATASDYTVDDVEDTSRLSEILQECEVSITYRKPVAPGKGASADIETDLKRLVGSVVQHHGAYDALM